MSQAVASLFDDEGGPSFDGLLDDIVPPTPEQLALVDALPDGLADMFLDAFEIDRFVAGRAGAAKRSAILEPTCNVSGLWSGYTAEGVMTITPAEAHARIDIRLVPDQNPDKILARLREHLDSRGFGDVMTRKLAWGTRAWTSPDATIVRAVSRAVESVWAKPPSILVTDRVRRRCGTSVPNMVWPRPTSSRNSCEPPPCARREHPARRRGECRAYDGPLRRRIRGIGALSRPSSRAQDRLQCLAHSSQLPTGGAPANRSASHGRTSGQLVT